MCFVSISQARPQLGCQNNTALCNTTGGDCSFSGLCICKQFYTGADCGKCTFLIFYSFPDVNNDVQFIRGDVSGGGIAGIVIGWLIGAPLVLILVYLKRFLFIL